MKRNWEYKKLGDVCTDVTDFVAAGSFADLRKNVVYNSEQDYAQLIRTTDLKRKFLNNDFVYVSKSAFEYLWRVNLDKACVVLPNVGNCGEVYYVSPEMLPYKNNVLAPNSILVRSYTENQRFLAYAFQGLDFQLQLKTITGTVAQPKFNKTNLKNLIIPIPPLDEQSRIVAELDLLTGIVDKQNAQLKELDNLAQAIFYDMFGDPIENPKRWEVKKLGDVSTSVSYGTSSPSSTVGKYKYLRMNNITYEGFLDLTDLKYIDMDDAEFEKYSVREGDVLFNRTNSMDLIGKTTYIHNMEPMIIAGYIIRVRLVDSVLPVYVSKFMNMPAMKKKLKGMAKGAVNQANINSKELKSIDIPLPSLALQQSFAEKIQSIEKQKETIRASIADTQKLLDYTMDKYFG